MSSRLDDVMSALVTTFTASSSLTGVDVRDGPPLDGVGDADFVLVGHDGTPDSNADMTVEQEWADLGCTSRYENGEVICAVVSQTGDTDLQVRRDRAFTLLAACESALVADRTLGGLVMSAQFVRGAARQFQNRNGSAVVAQFTVTYFAQV